MSSKETSTHYAYNKNSEDNPKGYYTSSFTRA
jgi:hypothetical protein